MAVNTTHPTPAERVGIENRARVRGWFRDHPGGSQRECSQALRLSPPAVNRHVQALREEWDRPDPDPDPLDHLKEAAERYLGLRIEVWPSGVRLCGENRHGFRCERLVDWSVLRYARINPLLHAAESLTRQLRTRDEPEERKHG